MGNRESETEIALRICREWRDKLPDKSRMNTGQVFGLLAPAIVAALVDARAPHWESIDTAPKDGTRILIADVAYVTQGFWDRETEDEGGQCWREDNPDWERAHPTHWMPLPDPPEVK